MLQNELTIPLGTDASPTVVFGPVVTRGGDRAIVSIQAISLLLDAGTGTAMTVQLQHKNLEDTSFSDVSNATVDIDDTGIFHIVSPDSSLLKELVRCKFPNTTGNAARVEMLPPNFLDDQGS
jgi:hypothetical protein